MTDMSTTSCVQAFLQGWMSRFGVPVRLTSDRGAQFTSELWREMTRSLGVDIHQTTAYHPQSNGAVEQLHRQLKASLTACLDTTSVLLGLRLVSRDELGASVAELVYGIPLLLPGEFVAPSAEDTKPTPAILLKMPRIFVSASASAKHSQEF